LTRVVVADDHEVVRRGLGALINAEADLEIVGEADDGVAAAHLVEQVKPDVLVLDLMMGGMNGLEVARQVRRSSPDTAIVVLSMYDNEAYVVEALDAGVMAYVLKGSPTEEVVRAIRQVAQGHRYLAPPLSERAIEAYVQKLGEAPQTPYQRLTGREREVLHLAAHGSTNAEIADRLCISRRTVEVHRSNMMRKLGLNTQTDLIRYALETGILPRQS